MDQIDAPMVIDTDLGAYSSTSKLTRRISLETMSAVGGIVMPLTVALRL